MSVPERGAHGQTLSEYMKAHREAGPKDEATKPAASKPSPPETDQKPPAADEALYGLPYELDIWGDEVLSVKFATAQEADVVVKERYPNSVFGVWDVRRRHSVAFRPIFASQGEAEPIACITYHGDLATLESAAKPKHKSKRPADSKRSHPRADRKRPVANEAVSSMPFEHEFQDEEIPGAEFATEDEADADDDLGPIAMPFELASLVEEIRSAEFATVDEAERTVRERYPDAVFDEWQVLEGQSVPSRTVFAKADADDDSEPIAVMYFQGGPEAAKAHSLVVVTILSKPIKG